MSTEQSPINQTAASIFDAQPMPVQLPREDSTGCDSHCSFAGVSMPPPTPVNIGPRLFYDGELPLGRVGGNDSFFHQKPAHHVHFDAGNTDDTESTMASTTASVTETEMESVISADYRDPLSWEVFTVPDTPDKTTTTVYEAWDVIAMDDSERIFTWKRFMGIRFGMQWESQCDGYVQVNSLLAFEQGELADMVNSAARNHGAKQLKDGGKKFRSYDQDLANRAYKLPADVYNQIQRLIDRKAYETNKNPHRQRTWTLVLLREEDLPITALAPERKKKGIFRRRMERPAVDRWFVVIKGEETKFSKEGWKKHDRYTNPWIKVDKREMLADRVERGGSRRDGGSRH